MSNSANCVGYRNGNLKNQILRAREPAVSPVVFIHTPKTWASTQSDVNRAFPDNMHVPSTDKKTVIGKTPESIEIREPRCCSCASKSWASAVTEGKWNSIAVGDLPMSPRGSYCFSNLWAKTNPRKDPAKFSSPGTFDKYCERVSKNHYCDSLVGQTHTAEETIEKVVDRFRFVGGTEFSHVCQAFYLPPWVKHIASINVAIKLQFEMAADWAEIDQNSLTHATNGMQIDLALFEFFYSRWSKRANDVVESLMKQITNRRIKQLPNFA